MTATIKKYLAIAGLCLAAIVAGLIVYGNYQHTQYLQAKGESKALTAEFNTFKTQADAAILATTQEINAIAKEKQAAIDAANIAAQSQAATQAELNRLKGETAALPPDALSGHIETYIGAGNISLTGSGLFSFTRPGTETTLNIFYERDAFQIQNGAYQTETADLKTAISKSDSVIAAWTEKYSLRDGEYTRALAAWGADRDALSHLRKSIFGLRTKSLLIGAGIGAAAVIIYNLIKPSASAIDGVAVIKAP